uniref:LMBR1 domain-containing protein 2 n=1 Tax=Anthurium amnicola TaxID=1678845 RepID=A0A1D1ZKW7_9ARAE
MDADSDSDSDAPEELTAEQGTKQYEEISKIERDNKMRVSQEGKERRRKWAQRKTQKSSSAQDVTEMEPHEEAHDTHGMLPSNIVELLAAREKQAFSSDTEEETIVNEPITRKKPKFPGPEPVILRDLPSAQCLENSVEFLKKRKMQVHRSQATLKNADRALRLISSRGGLFPSNR